MDGSGYPAGINDTEIPFGARILCLFDHFDQLTSGRSAQKRIPVADALDQITNKSRHLFDEGILPDFISFIESGSGKSENYLLKKEQTFIRETFSQILHHFKTGKLTPPVVPHVIKEIQSVFKSESATADELARVLEKDPVISLRLIAVANSPIYRGFSEIRNVRNAIPRLGLKETMSLVVAIAHKSLYQTDKVQFKILMDKLWLHSLATAYGAKLLAHELMLDDPEYLFLLGVTHDIGKIVLLKAFTDIFAGQPFQMDAIRSNMQEGHIEITRMLLKRWGFGEDFIRILTHHEAEAYNSSTEKEILIINLANMLTNNIGFGLIEEDVGFSELESARLLKMEPNKIEDIGKKIKKIIQDVAHLF
jgi:HD-like signal output (HDOD) protein